MQQSSTPAPEAAGAAAAEVRLGALGGLAGFHVRMAHAAFLRDFTFNMASIGLTQAQYAVLELVSGNSGVSQIDIARALGSDRATMMALVNKLAALDVLRRQPSPVDGRRQELHVTPAGERLLDRARRAIAGHEARMLAPLTSEETEALVTALRKIYVAAPQT